MGLLFYITMFNVIRIPTKFNKPISRLNDKDQLRLYKLIRDIWDWKTVEQTDDSVWDLLSLIYSEWMNMEVRNWYKRESSHLSIPEWVKEPCPSDSGRRVEYSIIEDNRIDISIETEQVPTYWKEEINMMQWFLRQAVWVSAFKDSKERWYVQHCYNLMKKIGKEEFQARLQWILSDQFKAKNCNKLAYLYWELKSYIHSPIVEPAPKRFITSV